MRKQVQKTFKASFEGWLDFDYYYNSDSRESVRTATIDRANLAEELGELVGFRGGNYRLTIELLPDEDDD